MKKISVHLLIVLILTGVFCDGYFSISCISNGRLFINDNEVYAYGLPTGYEPVSTDDLTAAFRAYCRSRDLTYEGSIADAVTSVSSAALQRVISTLGISNDELQAECYKNFSGAKYKWFFTVTGVNLLNRIFAQLLQDYDLSVGQEHIDETVKSGEWFIDSDGYGCFVFVINRSNNWISSETVNTGTTYKYDGFSYYNYFYPNGLSTENLSSTSTVWNLSEGLTVTVPMYFYRSSTVQSSSCFGVANSNKGLTNNTLLAVNLSSTDPIRTGAFCVYRLGEDLFFSHYTYRLSDGFYYFISHGKITNGYSEDTNVSVVSTKIQAPLEVPEGDEGIIINDDGTSDDSSDPVPDQPSGPDLPDWGGGGGTGTIGSDGTFDFDIPFTLPDLDIDWSLKNIGNKFPFCIPSDIVSFYQTLAVDPRAPVIDAHIPLGSFYDWHFEADFSQYDNWARIMRAVEYIGFVIGLIYFTIKLVKG